MEQLPESYEFFFKALLDLKKEGGTGFQNRLALSIGKSEGYVSQLLRKKTIASFNLQNSIAEACGYSYLEFLQYGKDLSEGKEKSKESTPGKPTPMDPAIRIMEEALDETGVKINEKQKMAVIKIIREELEKSKHHTKDDIKRYLDAFGK